jgi:hypothetical protein
VGAVRAVGAVAVAAVAAVAVVVAAAVEGGDLRFSTNLYTNLVCVCYTEPVYVASFSPILCFSSLV